MPKVRSLSRKGAGHELAAVVMAERHACSAADLIVAPSGPDRHSQALDGLQSRAPQRDTDAQALASAMVDEDKDGGIALISEAAGGVDDPHPVSDDGAVVDLGAADGGGSLVSERPLLAHDAQHSPHGGADALLLPQPCPDLAVVRADEGACD